MDAVRFRRSDRVAFVEAVPSRVLGPLAEVGGEITTDVQLDDPGFPHIWRDDSPRSRAILYVSRSDPKRFRVVDEALGADPAGFERLGPNFSTYPLAQFELFVRNLRELNRIAAHTDEHDTVEAWDEVMRELGHADEPASP